MFFFATLFLDPVYLDKFNIQSFHHLKNGLKLEDQKDAKKFLKEANQETRDTLKELREKRILEGTGAGILRYVYTNFAEIFQHCNFGE